MRSGYITFHLCTQPCDTLGVERFAIFAMFAFYAKVSGRYVSKDFFPQNFYLLVF